ncbi:FKBP-type peptidyl-prolyl cis-trans isomerase [Enterobacteriaceae endosymbiont of Donacia tomentosa]|uniref:FKBP-type peptidyl-prolyl cis-trans isomerase n=1 Tax=Enterobacteriaceae endosymbiont of Donacia tomentosa TaxID=2675787 RepID=UPI00144973D7|nr:FKBP-type peptidyl-prolyl cis-trans isomerase [Enterobacteriaceae endosymbiont of Donacia tomentosa]QJC31762.1 FKBP-type peptidyl-prolyl cis-trans isomerase [Enterobacteriaceae endosymbiont of Donacia tomentosa]
MRFFNRKKTSILMILLLSIGLGASSAINAAVPLYRGKNVKLWKQKNKSIKTKIIKKKNPRLKSQKKQLFKTAQQRMSYALGVSVGKYLEDSLELQNKFKIKLQKNLLIQGIQDYLNKRIKMSNQEIATSLSLYESGMKKFSEKEIKNKVNKSSVQAQNYIKTFLKEKNVKRSSTGLLYQIKKMGSGKRIIKSDVIVVVNYKGTLIDGTEFDNSYFRKEPLFVNLQRVILGWQEGLRYIRTGGKIKLVVPPKLAYGQEMMPGIPNNSTLIFDIELLDIKKPLSK